MLARFRSGRIDTGDAEKPAPRAGVADLAPVRCNRAVLGIAAGILGRKLVERAAYVEEIALGASLAAEAARARMRVRRVWEAPTAAFVVRNNG